MTAKSAPLPLLIAPCHDVVTLQYHHVIVKLRPYYKIVMPPKDISVPLLKKTLMRIEGGIVPLHVLKQHASKGHDLGIHKPYMYAFVALLK